MKVLFISNDPGLFLEGSAVRSRMKSYADAIGDLSIVSPGVPGEVHDGNLHIYGVADDRMRRVRLLTDAATKIIKERGIELVSAQDPFECGLAALRAAKVSGIPLHIQVHTDFLSPWFARGFSKASLLNGIRVSLAARVLPHASGIRVVSERVKRSLITKYGTRIPEPVVIPIAVSEVVPVPVPFPENPFSYTFITVGRLEAEKRVEDVIDAFALIASSYPKAGLMVVGEGRLKGTLEGRARQKGLDGRVLFLGARNEDARGLMRSTNAFVQASAYEGYGLTLVEAALAKVPIITTDVGIVGSVLVPGKDAFIAEVGDVGKLAAHMETLMRDSRRGATLAEHAEASVRLHLAKFKDRPRLIAEDLARTLAGTGAKRY